MDDASLAALRNSLASANFWMLASTVLVTAGVVVEFAELLLFNRDMSRLQRRILFVGALLVIVGCAGEFWFEKQAGDLEAKLQQASDLKVAGLVAAEAADNKLAQQATDNAAHLGLKVDKLPAFVKAKEAELDKKSKALRDFADVTRHHDDETIAALNSGRADLEKTRAAAAATVSHAETQIAESNATVENVRLAIKPRELTSAQLASFVSAMRPWASAYGGHQRVAVFSVTGSFESARLANQIADALGTSGAGWDVSRYPVTYGKGYAVAGVGLLVSASDRAQKVAGALAAALGRSQIAVSRIPDVAMDCVKIGMAKSIGTDPSCSAISIEVGDHP